MVCTQEFQFELGTYAKPEKDGHNPFFKHTNESYAATLTFIMQV